MKKEIKRRGIVCVVAAAGYAAALAGTEYWQLHGNARMLVFLIPYLLMVWETGRLLWKSLRKRKLFDENLLILLATVGAFFVHRYSEAVGAMLFFQIGKLVETFSMLRTHKSIEKFMDIRPQYANLKISGGEIQVPPEELNPRQIIIIKPGERIPVDAVVTQGISTLDTKALTGEAEPRQVQIGSRIYSGSINISGVLEARVLKASADSTASRIIDMISHADNRRAGTENFAEKFTRYYTPLVTLFGILVMILPPMMLEGTQQETWFYRGLIVLVAACPCGLLLSVPLAFLGGIGAASRQGVLIKGSNFLEALSKTDTFVFDKTGTLTEGVFRVKKVCPKKMEPEELLELTAYGEAYSSHPIAVSLQEAYQKPIQKERIQSVKEFPGFGLEAVVDGKQLEIGNSKFMNQRGYFYQRVSEIGTAVHVAVDGEYAGYILITDVIRKEAGWLLKWLKRHQLEAVIVTGDNERVAEDTARKLKIDYVYANLMPEEKVEQVEEFMESQLEDEKLAFIGDGINDAPVLARADIGIAMGGLGADAALEAADIILMEDDLSRVVNAIRISKGTIRAVKQNLIFAIGMKVILLALASLGYVTMKHAILADMAVMMINLLNSFWVLKYPE